MLEIDWTVLLYAIALVVGIYAIVQANIWHYREMKPANPYERHPWYGRLRRTIDGKWSARTWRRKSRDTGKWEYKFREQNFDEWLDLH